MARENIEDKDFADPRFIALAMRLNCQFTAMGVWVSIRRLGGEYWRQDMAFVPRHVWDGAGYPAALFETGLAWYVDENGNRTDPNMCSAVFVYVEGTRERNAWFYETKDKKSAAGKKSAEARRAKHGSAQPGVHESPNGTRTDSNTCSNSVEQTSTQGQQKAADGNSAEPSYSCSVSGSVQRQGNIHAGARGPQPVQPDSVDQDKRNREIAECETVWLATIQELGVERNFVRPEEQSVMWQLINKFGAKEAALILEGARYETASKGYDPRQHVNIARAWNRSTAWSDMARNPSLRGQSEQPSGASIAEILDRQKKAGAV